MQLRQELGAGFLSLSSCHFSFFEQGQQAKINPSYLLFPNVRQSDQDISLSIIRTGKTEQRARQANFNRGQISPFGVRQVSYTHNINRFRQARNTLKDVRELEEADKKRTALKAIVRRINALSKRVLTLEEKDELTELRVKLSPSYAEKCKTAEQAEKEQFKKIWQTITANSLNSEAAPSE